MSKHPFALKFSLALLEKEPMTLEGELPPEFLELEENEMLHAAGPVKYRLDAQMITGNVSVTGSLSCPIEGECGRCLEPVTQTVAVKNLSLFYDELDELDELDVTEDVRTELLLALPMNLLCSPECKGLCPQCGANLNHGGCGCNTTEPAPPEEASPWNILDGLGK
ncbi:MAG: DUF177 domain-containing protein [Victivallaceae bacterium]|nr:DUF177 domain-containing protein [Victivallaceae bacterium]